MTRQRESELRVRGLGLRARFVVSMTVALTLVMTVAAIVIHFGSMRINEQDRIDAIARAVRFSEASPQDMTGFEKGLEGVRHPSGVEVFPFRHGDVEGKLYTYSPPDGSVDYELAVPSSDEASRNLARWLSAMSALVVVVGAVVALWVAGRVAHPVHTLIGDVRQIAKGDLSHHTKAVGEGEIELLSRAIGRMTEDLEEARANELELSIRQREREVAARVREALLPLATPLVPGYDLGAAFVSSGEFGGDFHDFIEREDGRVGLLVCDVSGIGIPAALVGSTARSYLRSELQRSDDIAASFKQVNRWLAADMRRGMFVSALYVLVDPKAGIAQVACAGHKVPLLRYDAEIQKLRTVHPEGIAFGFDRGPVFDRRIQVVDTPLEPGDRFVLANSAPVGLVDGEGRELGEKAFYTLVVKHAQPDTIGFLKGLRRSLAAFGGDAGLNRDVSLVTISREA